MAYVITGKCVCCFNCVDNCPSECIHPPKEFEDLDAFRAFVDESEDDEEKMKGMQLYIEPDECVDCGVCADDCDDEAIFPDDELPEEWESYKEKNATRFE